MVVGEIVNGKLYLLSFLIFPMLNTIEDKSMTIVLTTLSYKRNYHQGSTAIAIYYAMLDNARLC